MTKQRCGAIHPKQPKEVCARELGHVGMHTNGGNVTWKGPKAEPAPASKASAADAVFAPPKGEEAPTKSKARKVHQDEPAQKSARWINDWTWQDARGIQHVGSTIPKHALKSKPQPKGESGAPGTIKVHPAADALPLIEGAEFDALVEDIRANGQRTKCVLDHAGEWLVDGRNRKRACERLGIEPQYERLPEGTNIAAYVISTNLKRRHLTESQRAMIAAEIANLGQGQRKQTRPDGGFQDGVTQAEAAATAGVGERTVQRAKAVRDKAVPELVQAVKQGKVDLKGAEQVAKLSPKQQRELIRERVDPSKGPVRGGKLAAIARQETKRETVRKINTGKVAPMPAGQFGVIYVDYPWLYNNSDQHEGSRGHAGYPQMPIEAILAHAREAATRAAKDCVLALWVTNAHIQHIGDVVRAYGATQNSMFTWPKPKMGVGTWGRGQTEHLVLASIGEPVHTLNEVSTLLPAYELREHSRKPDEVAELLLKHCAGPFLELFSQEEREGWTSWGAETNKFSTEAA